MLSIHFFYLNIHSSSVDSEEQKKIIAISTAPVFDDNQTKGNTKQNI